LFIETYRIALNFFEGVEVPEGYADYLNRLLTFHFVPLNVIGKKEQ
jgi:hypothetical protein